jgi:hypothetical protein
LRSLGGSHAQRDLFILMMLLRAVHAAASGLS